VRVKLVAGAVAALCAVSGPAAASGNDFRLNGVDANGDGILFTSEGGFAANDPAFRSFATELGFLLSPRNASPAETLGLAGFEVGILWSGHFVSDANHWLLTEDGQQNQEASRFLQTLQLDLRKGLPLSFEIAATMAWLTDSQVFAPGVELRWAFHEGYDFLPDFALRGAVTTMVGNPDMDLTVISTDLVISKSIPAGAALRIAPYVSFGALFTAASTEVIDPTPTSFVPVVPGDPSTLRPDRENDIAFQSLGLTDEVYAKVMLGVRAHMSLVDLLVQGEVQMFRDGEIIGPAGTLTVKLALSF
jgi:hypothetical protein